MVERARRTLVRGGPDAEGARDLVDADHREQEARRDEDARRDDREARGEAPVDREADDAPEAEAAPEEEAQRARELGQGGTAGDAILGVVEGAGQVEHAEG